jgi:hypothetical protein
MKYKSKYLTIKNILDKLCILNLSDDNCYYYYYNTMILKYENKKLTKIYLLFNILLINILNYL